jgi:hypothetical protein
VSGSPNTQQQVEIAGFPSVLVNNEAFKDYEDEMKPT